MINCSGTIEHGGLCYAFRSMYALVEVIEDRQPNSPAILEIRNLEDLIFSRDDVF